MLLVVCALPALCAVLLAAEPLGAPAINFIMNLFTDRDGYRSMSLRGASARVGTNATTVTDLNVTIFTGDATNQVETVLLSPRATFFPKENRVIGSDRVRLIRDDLEVTGSDWSYDHAGKKVSIRKDVRVVYRAPLKIPL
jgi:hypothetical protein